MLIEMNDRAATEAMHFSLPYTVASATLESSIDVEDDVSEHHERQSGR